MRLARPILAGHVVGVKTAISARWRGWEHEVMKQGENTKMNSVMLSGTVADDSELRTLESGRLLLNFNLQLDGLDGKDPVIRVGFFPKDSDPKELKGGRRVAVLGALRHRNDYRGLFVAAWEIFISLSEANVTPSEESGESTAHSSRNGGK